MGLHTVVGIHCVFALSLLGFLYLLIGTFSIYLWSDCHIFYILLTFSKSGVEHLEIRRLDQVMSSRPELLSDSDYETLPKRFV